MSKNQTIISVELEQAFIPILIGGIEFKLYTSDEKQAEYTRYIDELRKKQHYFEEKAKQLEESSTPEEEIEFFEETRNSVKETIDISLGEGSFDKLYEKSGGSTTNICTAFFEVMSQYEKMKEKKKMKNYVSGKKKR